MLYPIHGHNKNPAFYWIIGFNFLGSTVVILKSVLPNGINKKVNVNFFYFHVWLCCCVHVRDRKYFSLRIHCMNMIYKYHVLTIYCASEKLTESIRSSVRSSGANTGTHINNINIYIVSTDPIIEGCYALRSFPPSPPFPASGDLLFPQPHRHAPRSNSARVHKITYPMT